MKERTSGPGIAGLNILCIDNYIDTLELLRLTLQFEGANVYTAKSGDEALFALKRASMDAVLCDLLMPKDNGIEVLQKLRAAGYEGPALALTGLSDPTVQAGALAEGFCQYLVKPVDNDLLVATIAAVAGKAAKNNAA